VTDRSNPDQKMNQWWWTYFGGSSPAEPKPEWRASMKRLSARVESGERMGLLAQLPGPELDGEEPADAGKDQGYTPDELETMLDAPPASASVTSSIFNLCNVCLGAGTLSMPFAFSKVGLVGGLIVLTFIYLTMVVSAVMLTDVARELKIRSLGSTYGALVNRVWGKNGTITTNCIVVIATFGIAISYFQLAGDLIAPPIGFWLGDTPNDYCHFFAKRHGPIVLALALQCALCAMPTLNALRYVSLLAVVSMLYLCVITVVRGGQEWNVGPTDDEDFEAFSLTSGIFNCISICTFAFAPHIQMVTLFSELKEPSKERTFKWLFTSFTLCWVVYGMVGSFGYYTFYNKTKGNIILNFNADDNAITAGRLGVALSVMAGYPMMMNPCVSALDALVFPNAEPSPWGRRLGWLAVGIGGSFGLAMLIDDVSIVLGLTGAGALTVASFIIPGALYVATFGRAAGGKCKTLMLQLAWAVVIAGLILGSISVVVTIIDDIVNHDGSDSCDWPVNCDPQRCCPPGGVYGPPVNNTATECPD